MPDSALRTIAALAALFEVHSEVLLDPHPEGLPTLRKRLEEGIAPRPMSRL